MIGAISLAVIEVGCGEMVVEVACPISREFGDAHDSRELECIFSRPTIRGGGDMMGGRQWAFVCSWMK